MYKIDDIIDECKENGPFDENNKICIKCQNTHELTLNDLKKHAPDDCPQVENFNERNKEMSQAIQEAFSDSIEELSKKMASNSIANLVNIRFPKIPIPKIQFNFSGAFANAIKNQFSLNDYIVQYLTNINIFDKFWDILLTKEGIEYIQKSDNHEWFTEKLHEYIIDEEKGRLIENYLCSKERPFCERKDQIMHLLKAYRGGNYIVSIPLSFIVFDGIVSQKIREPIKRKCECCKRPFRFDTTQLLQKLTGKKSSLEEDTKLVLEAIRELWESNRNDILHGRDFEYNNKDLALNLIINLIFIRGALEYIES